MKSELVCQCYRLFSSQYKNLVTNMDSIWQKNAPFVQKLFYENNINDSDICAKAKAKLQQLNQLSKTGGWLFTEGCLPIHEITSLPAPHQITFAFSRNSKVYSAQIMGIPPHSETMINDFISIVMSPQCHSLLQYEYLEEIAFDRAANQFASKCDVGKYEQVFYDEDILINRWGLHKHFVDLHDVIFVLMPISRFKNYDETEPYLYYNMEDILESDSVLGNIFRYALGTSQDLPTRLITPASHLGGHFHRTNMDIGALDVMMANCHVQSFIDIGCGTGGMVAYAKWKGLTAIGVDGDTSLPKYSFMVYHDFTANYTGYLLSKRFDLLWTVEFLEHIEEKFLPHLLGILKNVHFIVSTAAPPGKDGFHHVNCRNENYWSKWFACIGFEKDSELTDKVRKRSTMRSNFMRDNGIVWRHNND